MSTPEDLQALLGLDNRNESKDDILQWTLSMLQAKSGMDQAVGNFAVVTDKEIASKAAYKSMGLDPRDAPTFGWNMSERPRQSVTQNIMTGSAGQRDTASEQQPDRPVTPSPLAGDGGQVSSQPAKVSSLMKNIIGGLLIAAATGGVTGAYLIPKTNMLDQATQELQAIQQQQLIEKMQEVQAALKSGPSGSQSSPLEAMQLEICEELDSDPAFRDEIAADLQIIGQKILDHKQQRLNSNPSTPKE